MSRANMGLVVAAAWEDALLTSPDPWHGEAWVDLFAGRRRSYRERLDRREVNYRREVIPRIERVRRHLRQLGNVRLDPERLP